MTDLVKPCPFCGSEQVIVDTYEGAPWSLDSTSLSRAWCEDCSAAGPETLYGKKHAIQEWNDRPDSPADPVDAIVQITQKKLATMLHDMDQAVKRATKELPPGSAANHDALFQAVARVVNVATSDTAPPGSFVTALNDLIATFNRITRG